MNLLFLTEFKGSFFAADSVANEWLMLCWLGLLLFLTTFCLLAAGDICPTGFYANGTVEETVDCVPCNACEAGEGAAEPCRNHSDTVCEPCAEGHFSKFTSSGRECAECRFCTLGRTEAAPCTPTRDRVCGSCSDGFFLYVDHTGSGCLPCSKCPAADGEVVRWADCAAAGEPEDNRCAPGVWTVEHSTTTAPQPAVKPTGTVGTHKTKLPTNHGTFATMTNYDTVEKIHPLDRSTERTIAIVSVLFTVATALAFLLALTCLFREKIRRICRRVSTKKKTLSSRQKYFKKTRNFHYPVQVQDDSATVEVTYASSIT